MVDDSGTTPFETVLLVYKCFFPACHFHVYGL